MKLTPVACSFEITPFNGRIQLFPFGRFFPVDGRPEGEEGWYVDDTNANDLVAQINGAKTRPMIDYEHQTLYIAQNGQGNPAAGWIVRAEYVPNEGIFADVEWTDKARWEVKDKVYRYISPLFLADTDGKVVKFINAALTNRPALDELAEAYALSIQSTQSEEKPMLKLLQKLFASPNASEAEITEKLTALSAAQGDNGINLADVYGKLEAQGKEVVALSAKLAAGSQTPDPTQYVALSEMKVVQDELVALKAQINADKVNDLVEVALSQGKLLPSQKDWAIKLGQTDLVALSDYLKVASTHSALTQPQSGGKSPENSQVVALSAEQSRVAKMLGLTEAEYRARQQSPEQ